MEGFIIVVMALASFLIWIGARSMDKDRIRSYIEECGGRVVSINWAPFGRGWFGEKNDRIYEVVYYDREGKQHMASCKTSLFSGVYWTEDRITHSKAEWYNSVSPGNEPGNPLIRQVPEEKPEDEADELQRLREENQRLREQLAQHPGSSEVLDPSKCPACGADVPEKTDRCPSCEISFR